MRLDEQAIIVTGAHGNVGSAVAALLAARGARVVRVDRGGRSAPAADGGGRGLSLGSIDLMEPADCERVAQRALAAFGRIDGVVSTVGGFAMGPVADSGPDLWERMFRLNVLTTLNIYRAVLPPMRAARRGSLVSVAAAAALRAPAGIAAYAAAKSGLLRLTESAAEELKREGVRVNAVLPAVIDTPPNRADMPDADHAAWTTPREVAEAAAFLLSDAASGVTGALVPVVGRN